MPNTKKGIWITQWMETNVINVYIQRLGEEKQKPWNFSFITVSLYSSCVYVGWMTVFLNRNTQNLPFIITLLFKYRKQDIILLVTIISLSWNKHTSIYIVLCCVCYYHFIILLLDTFSAPNFNVGMYGRCLSLCILCLPLKNWYI